MQYCICQYFLNFHYTSWACVESRSTVSQRSTYTAMVSASYGHGVCLQFLQFDIQFHFQLVFPAHAWFFGFAFPDLGSCQLLLLELSHIKCAMANPMEKNITLLHGKQFRRDRNDLLQFRLIFTLTYKFCWEEIPGVKYAEIY